MHKAYAVKVRIYVANWAKLAKNALKQTPKIKGAN